MCTILPVSPEVDSAFEELLGGKIKYIVMWIDYDKIVLRKSIDDMSHSDFCEAELKNNDPVYIVMRLKVQDDGDEKVIGFTWNPDEATLKHKTPNIAPICACMLGRQHTAGNIDQRQRPRGSRGAHCAHDRIDVVRLIVDA